MTDMYATRNQAADIITNRLTGKDRAKFEPLVNALTDAVKAKSGIDTARKTLVDALVEDKVTRHLADRAVAYVEREASKSHGIAGFAL